MSGTRRFHPRLFASGLATSAVGWSLLDVPGDPTISGYAPLVMVSGGLLAAGTVYARIRPDRGSNRLIRRWDRKTRRHGGTASAWDILSTSSTWAMRRRAVVLRPSLRGVSRWRRWRAPVGSYATPLCRIGWQRVWTSVEESTLRVGIPGTGKSAELACRIIDAPGGVVVTSTAADLVELTSPLRQRRGPVRVFNPAGLGGISSSLRWSPLAGCTDPQTATRRAADLMGPPSASAEGERWDLQGRRVLGILLHAAALGGHRMREVAAWVANPDAGRRDILAALDRSPQAAEMRRAAEHTIDLTPRTRDGVMLSIAPAVGWVTNPAACTTGDAETDLFGPAELIDAHGCLYLLGDDDGQVAPLVGALLAEIVHQARAAAASRPGGRLDPALTFALDEIALVCPVPLDRWMAELRKRSIVIHAAGQGLGQLRQRWGTNGASMILNSAAAVLVFGGCKDADDLALFGQLTGDREQESLTRDAEGNITARSTHRVPVIAPAMLAGLPNHQALLIRRGMPPALGRTPVAWQRRDVKRAIAAEARVVRAAERAARNAARDERVRALVAHALTTARSVRAAVVAVWVGRRVDEATLRIPISSQPEAVDLDPGWSEQAGPGASGEPSGEVRS